MKKIILGVVIHAMCILNVHGMNIGNLVCSQDVATGKAELKQHHEKTFLAAAEEGGKEGLATFIDLFEKRKDLDLNTDVVDAEGNTALILAAGRGNTDIVKFILENLGGFKIFGYSRAKNNMKRNALIMAAYGGHLPAVKLLQPASYDKNERDIYGRTALSYAAQNGNTNVVDALLDAHADETLADEQGLTPLMYAAENGHVDIVKLFLNMGWIEQLLEAKDKKLKLTALERARKAGQEEVVKLIEDKMDEGARQERTEALHKILSSDKDITAKELQNSLDQGVNVNWRSYGNPTMLDIVVQRRRADLVPLLLKAGADPLEESFSTTIFGLAAGHGDVNIVKMFLTHGVNVNARDKQGRTALMQTARWGDLSILKLLLAAKADVNIQSPYQYKTALDFAFEGLENAQNEHKKHLDWGWKPDAEIIKEDLAKIAEHEEMIAVLKKAGALRAADLKETGSAASMALA